MDIQIDKIRENFEKRLEYAVSEFNRHRTTSYTSVIMEKILEFHDLSPTSFCFFFQNITGWSDLNSLEGIEGLNYFVGNFVDDSYFKIVYDKDALRLINDCKVRNDEVLGIRKSKPVSAEEYIECWKISGCTDDDPNFLRENELLEILDKLIELENRTRKLIKESEMFDEEGDLLCNQ